MIVGILALQGAIQPHIEKLAELSIETHLVKQPDDLNQIDGLILPGGESTTFLHLINRNRLYEPLNRFLKAKPGWGICAGAIVMARKVFGPSQDSLKVIDIEIQRNAYGRQLDSFIGEITPSQYWKTSYKEEAVFIRAPKITELGQGVLPLFFHNGETVMVEQAHLLASSFHPELGQSTTIHRYFVDKIRAHAHA